MSKQVRFLVLRGGAIGDFIFTLPALQALRDRWPDAHIELLGYPHIANLALAGGLVDHVGSLDRADVARFFAAHPLFTEQQTEYIESFDLILSYLHDPEGVVRSNLLAAGARQVLYGSPLVTEGHAVDQFLKPLESLALYGEKPSPRLDLGEPARARGRAWLAERGWVPGFVAVHPGSGSPKKNWPVEHFVELADRFRASPKPVLFVLGEADHAVAEMLRAYLAGVPVLTGLSLVDTASVLSSGGGFVGNDSGITHIAAALGLRVAALFGPTDPDRWGPRGSNVSIVRAPGGKLDQLVAEAVWEIVKDFGA
jgi:heptosyltransferase III